MTSTSAGPSCASAAASASSSWARSVTRMPSAPQFCAYAEKSGLCSERLPDVPLAGALLLGDLAELAVVEQDVGDVHAVLDRGGQLGHVLAEAAVAGDGRRSARVAASPPRRPSRPG